MFFLWNLLATKKSGSLMNNDRNRFENYLLYFLAVVATLKENGSEMVFKGDWGRKNGPINCNVSVFFSQSSTFHFLFMIPPSEVFGLINCRRLHCTYTLTSVPFVHQWVFLWQPRKEDNSKGTLPLSWSLLTDFLCGRECGPGLPSKAMCNRTGNENLVNVQQFSFVPHTR